MGESEAKLDKGEQPQRKVRGGGELVPWESESHTGKRPARGFVRQERDRLLVVDAVLLALTESRTPQDVCFASIFSVKGKECSED